MTRLRYFTSESVEYLRSTISDHLDWYYEPDIKPLPWFGDSRESKLAAPALANGISADADKPHATDVDNALFVYESLANLTPHQASIERMWVYLSHCDCPKYVAMRWLKDRPKKTEDAVRKVHNHYFATGNRGIIRDNAISRLWWLGKIAFDADPDDPRHFLTILLHRQDVRSALIERPSVSLNPGVLRRIYAVMREYWDGDREFFKRDAFRNWMTGLNRRGGVVMLDALPEDALDELLQEEVSAAIEND